MRAFKCDLCGKLSALYSVKYNHMISDDPKGVNTLTLGCVEFCPDYGTHPKTTYELCKECCKSFNEWQQSRKAMSEDMSDENETEQN